MGVIRQLYQLQELDLEIESSEQALRQKASQLGESETVNSAKSKLAAEQRRLDELKHQQHSAEWEINDLEGKIKDIEDKLYGGRITSPKELSSLQHESKTLKAKRDQLETKALETMEQVELVEASVVTISNEVSKLESEWRDQQQELSAEIARLENGLSVLRQRRQLLIEGIDPQAVGLYEQLRKQKGQAVARVEQGICQCCRISLSSSELQQVRSGNLVQCGSCGRALFLP